MANEVKQKEQSNVVAFDKNLLLQDAGSASENMSQDDMMIPRLNILQAQSPIAMKADPAYVKGAEAGFIVDTVSNEIIDGEKGITVVPISYRRTHLEWKPDRGGLVKDHGNDPFILTTCTQDKKGKYFTEEGNQIVPTGEYMVYVIDGESFSPALISMSSSQLKKSRRWNSMMNRLQVPSPDGKGVMNPAMFYTAYQMTTIPEKNDEGTWFGWNVEILYDAKSGGIIENLKNGSDIYLAARDFKSKVAAGEVKVKADDLDDDKIPF
tara:strand:- start:53 stop:850 length:798 start_codon:yes stop_codon:yes gene_type:complete